MNAEIGTKLFKYVTSIALCTKRFVYYWQQHSNCPIKNCILNANNQLLYAHLSDDKGQTTNRLKGFNQCKCTIVRKAHRQSGVNQLCSQNIHKQLATLPEHIKALNTAAKFVNARLPVFASLQVAANATSLAEAHKRRVLSVR